MSDKYRIVGPAYDFMSSIYSFGAISSCKNTVLETMKPGDRVLFAGAGHGEDAIAATLAGGNVTVVELSRTMADQLATKFRDKLANSELITDAYEVGKLEIIVKDIFKYEPNEEFDYVVSNFFLNVFSPETMVHVMQHLARLTKNDGAMVVGDFKYPTGNIIQRILQNVYWFLADIFFVVMSGNSFHEVHDYREMLSVFGFKEQTIYDYSFLGIGYEAIVARKTKE